MKWCRLARIIGSSMPVCVCVLMLAFHLYSIVSHLGVVTDEERMLQEQIFLFFSSFSLFLVFLTRKIHRFIDTPLFSLLASDVDPRFSQDISIICLARIATIQIYHEILSPDLLPVTARVSMHLDKWRIRSRTNAFIFVERIQKISKRAHTAQRLWNVQAYYSGTSSNWKKTARQ